MKPMRLLLEEPGLADPEVLPIAATSVLGEHCCREAASKAEHLVGGPGERQVGHRLGPDGEELCQRVHLSAGPQPVGQDGEACGTRAADSGHAVTQQP